MSGSIATAPFGERDSLRSGDAPVLVVENLTRNYKLRDRSQGLTAANDLLNLQVRPGELVALLGPNGAGKTTLLRQVAGQLLPSAGRIWVNGVDMIADPRGAKEHLSVIPQECLPMDSLTVEEHVRYFGLIKGLSRSTAKAEVATILTRVGLTEHSSKLIRELSGGLKRRVLIAIALCGTSLRLILLDEPTTGLDPEGRRSVWKVIETLKEQRIGILLTTHYIEEAEMLADRVIVIDEGRFVLSGTVEEIRARLPNRGRMEIRGMDRLRPEAIQAIDALSPGWPITLRTLHSLRLAVPDPFAAETVATLARLTALGVQASLAPVSLEDVYLSVVGSKGALNGA